MAEQEISRKGQASGFPPAPPPEAQQQLALPPPPAGYPGRSRGELQQPVLRTPPQDPSSSLMSRIAEAETELKLLKDRSIAYLRDNQTLPRDTPAPQWQLYAKYRRCELRAQILTDYLDESPSLKSTLALADQLAKWGRQNEARELYSFVAKHQQIPPDYSFGPTKDSLDALWTITSAPWFKGLSELEQKQVVEDATILRPGSNPNFPTLFAQILAHQNFAALSGKEKTQVYQLAMAMRGDAEDIGDLLGLLKTKLPSATSSSKDKTTDSGKCVLLDRDFSDGQGKTLLENLLQFANPQNTKLGKYGKLDLEPQRQALLHELLQECNRFHNIDQADHGTCVATTLELSAAWKHPAELARVASALLQMDGLVTCKGGQVLRAIPDSFPDDFSGRTCVERVFQASLMDLGIRIELGNQWRYSSKDDKFYSNDGRTLSTGLTLESTKGIFDAFYGVKHSAIETDGTQNFARHVVRVLEEVVKPGQVPRTVVLSISLPTRDNSKQPENHAVFALGIDEETTFAGRETQKIQRLVFFNPWGATSLPDKTELPGGLRVQDGKRGWYSIPLETLTEKGRVNWLLVEPKEGRR